MGELRKDYILDRWVIISPKRSARPHELSRSAAVEEGKCLFCPGNESSTPSEIGRVPGNGGWQLRWFENKFPAVKAEGSHKIKTEGRFYTSGNAFGYHEVIVETPRHDKQLAELPVEDIEKVLNVYARRIVELESKPNIAYVNVFKNSGYLGGTSIVHSHSQVIATTVVPPDVRNKLSAMLSFISCPYCAIIPSEKKSERFCFENDAFVAFTPYASRFNYEVWIFPKMHSARFEELDFSKLAEVLSKVLRRVHELNIDYDMFVHYAPKESDLFHVHLEICPRRAIWAGFELESGIIINSVSPEDAAKFYRGEE